MSDIAVDPAGLAQVGATVHSLGSRLASAVPPGAEGSVQPAGVGDGWAAWPAMRQAGGAWQAEIRTLASTLASVGGALAAAANAYEASDQHTTGRLGGGRAV